jgi:hypothetical protein
LQILQKNEAEAINQFPGGVKRHPGVFAQLHIAILQDAAGNTDARDLAVQTALEKSAHGSALNAYLKLLAKTFANDPDSLSDENAIDDILKTAKGEDRTAIYYLTARLLDKRGKKDEATYYLLQGIDGQSNDNIDTILIADALTKRGIDPASLERATTQPSD